MLPSGKPSVPAETAKRHRPTASTATSPQPKKKTSKDSIIAYVHNLSPIRRNRTNTFDYATMTLQTSQTESCEALLYSPPKRSLFQNSQEARTPVKLKDFAYTEDMKKIVINDMTFVGAPQQSEYSFQHAEIPEAEQPVTSILHALNVHNEWDVITVQAKVTKMNDPVAVKKGLQLSEAVITDKTASIPLDVWESHISNLKKGSTFTFHSVHVRLWSGKKKLSTAVRSKIVPLKDASLESIAVDTTEDVDKECAIKEFLMIQKYEKFLRCKQCKKKIPQTTCSKVVHCTKCGIMRSDKCSSGLTTKVAAVTEQGDEISLKIGDEVLAKILDIANVLSLDQETVAEKLLFVEHVSVKYNSDNLVTAVVQAKVA